MVSMKKISFVLMMLLALPAVSYAAAYESRPILDQDLGAAIWTVVLFVLLFAFLGIFVWPKILKGLQAREEKILNDLNSAEEAAKVAAAKVEEYEKKLAEATAEAQAMLDKSRVDAAELRAKLNRETEEEINRLKAHVKNEINQARQQAVADVYEIASTLSTAVASKLIERELSEADSQALIESAIKEIGDAKAG